MHGLRNVAGWTVLVVSLEGCASAPASAGAVAAASDPIDAPPMNPSIGRLPADDAMITAKVVCAMAAPVVIRARGLAIETSAGVVTLSGNVESERARREAEAAARSVRGVLNVRNRLVVEPDRWGSGLPVE